MPTLFFRPVKLELLEVGSGDLYFLSSPGNYNVLSRLRDSGLRRPMEFPVHGLPVSPDPSPHLLYLLLVTSDAMGHVIPPLRGNGTQPH